MLVNTVGDLFGGKKHALRLSDTATVECAAKALGIVNPAGYSYRVSGERASLTDSLYDGCTLTYTMKDIKGA